ncbi:uncharacterized protein LOC128958723 [Oppia nitens]|uniref:uncharacterized protein LOC128958723 n=1 Tax=Oppia nitens TaxID=1686743 RepID=UPI0023D99693|nr:uncharacterized protein LOC128958723 [Oppia nitens]
MMDDLTVPLVMVAATVSLVASLMVCICRDKPKTTSALTNGHNLLPLNSIRSTDLANNPELIRYNGGTCMATDDVDSHLRHNQRALPDIPLAANSLLHIPNNEVNRETLDTIDGKHAELKSRSTKARAPPPPTHHRVVSSPLVATDDDLHHSYARIKDNAIIDSSENETDDYSDSQFYSAVVTHNSDHSCPPVPTKRFTNDHNNDINYISSNPSTSRAGQDMQYMGSPVLHRLHHLNEEQFPHLLVDENPMDISKSEISYNTISVREPLAKVLAERANSEHHYNEVEEERVSSFYEEIAGSTASSVTYSKIGDNIILSDNSSHKNLGQKLPNITNGVPIGHLYPLEASTSSSTQQSFTNITPNCDLRLTNNYPKDLYSSVDKKMKSKRNNRQTIHCIPDSDNEFDNLYAKVQKHTNNMPKESNFYPHPRPSSVSDVDPMLLSDNGIPPPLPPPLKSFHSTSQSRSSRTISLYDSSNSATNSHTGSHQRRYSSGTQSINTTDWHNRDVGRDMNTDYFTYGAVGGNEVELESDPGYEVIQRKKTNTTTFGAPNTMVPMAITHVNGINSPSDPGYEAIRYDESDNDPNYEVIVKKVNTNSQTVNISDPGYEVIIKKESQITPKTHSPCFEYNINRNLSDVSSEPGYERIRYTKRSVDQIESEPNYASIMKNEDLYAQEEEDETISERL